ncbi:MAG: recombinase family protein, partial [Sphaerochaetaceae bacterium]|nr:recombinase family protein [Sphaerochaetaceae bacterium]
MKISRIPYISKPSIKKQVAAYARVSTSNEEQEASLETQLSYFSNLISSNPSWNNAGIYFDQGISGTSTKNRSGFNKMIEDAKNGKINLILTKSISRFGRNAEDLLATVQALKEKNVEVFFERENLYSLSGEGELMLSLLATFAEEEARSTSESVKWAYRNKCKRGQFAKYKLFGYTLKDGEYKINEKQAETIRLIFSSYLEGFTPLQIAEQLNKKGLKAFSGGNFTYQTIWKILRQSKYCGTVTLQSYFIEDFRTHRKLTNRGEFSKYIIPDVLPPIITKQTFLKTQEEIARRAALGCKARKNCTFSSFTSIITCSHCHATYRRRMVKKGYYRWACSTRLDHGGLSACPSAFVPEKELLRLAGEVKGKIEKIEVRPNR